jgi:hypothetical protein
VRCLHSNASTQAAMLFHTCITGLSHAGRSALRNWGEEEQRQPHCQ